MPRRYVPSGTLIASSLAAIAVAALALHVLHGFHERAEVALAEHVADERWTLKEADALEANLRRVLMLTERAKEPGASGSRIDLAIAEHDSLQHELALLEASAEWSAGAATLFDLRQLLARMREQLAAMSRSTSAAGPVAGRSVRSLTGDAPQALTLFEEARADVGRSLGERSVRLGAQQHRLGVVTWWGTAGFVLLLVGSGLVLYAQVVRPLSRIRAAVHQAIASGEPPRPVTAGSGDIVALSEQVCRLVAQVDERQSARVATLRDQLAVLTVRMQEAQQVREQAEQSSRNRADFIVQLGHELRTPLTGMLGLVDLLADDVRSATGQRRLQSIQGAALLLRGVLDRMAEATPSRLVRVEAGGMTSQRERTDAAGAVPVPEATEASHPPGARVLVAEDHAINQVVITEMLEHLGHAVEVVPDGRSAVERVRDQLFDVVLMDWAMPEMDGVEAARLIRAEEFRSGRPRVPIIALTAHTVAENRRECLAAGMDDFLAKPVSIDALDAAIRRAVA